MKKLFILIFGLLVSSNLFAYEFDGINLNEEVIKVTRQVAKRGYVTDPERGCFKGNCKGKEIYLSFDFENVTETNHVGALMIDVPMKHTDSYENCIELLNVVYHQESESAEGVRYVVDNDGTVMLLSKTADGIRLTYFTSYHKDGNTKNAKMKGKAVKLQNKNLKN